MPKVKLTEVVLEGFRGARRAVRLAVDNGASLALFGNNGDGKSSISDALEWFFCDGIDHLGSEGCTREDYFHQALDIGEDARVCLSFTDPRCSSDKVLRRRGGSQYSNTAPQFEAFIRSARKDRLLLRHHTMRAFVDKTKKEKLEELEDIVGFGAVRSIRNELVRARNALKNDTDWANLVGMLKERERDIQTLVGQHTISEKRILATADQLRRQLDYEVAIVDVPLLMRAGETASKQFRAEDKGRLLARLSEAEALIPTAEDLHAHYSTVADLIGRHNALVSKRELIESDVLSKLYQAASEVFERKLVRPNVCPLCGGPVDTEKLAERLADDLNSMGLALSERRLLLSEVEQLERYLTRAIERMAQLCSEDTKDVFSDDALSTALTEHRLAIEQWLSGLRRVASTLEPVELPSLGSGWWATFTASVKAARALLDKQRGEALASDAERTRYECLSKLQNIAEWYKRYMELHNRISLFEQQLAALKQICEDFDRTERQGLQSIVDVLSEDVDRFFSEYLHPEDSIRHVVLKLTEARGIEFEIEFHGAQISPPRRVLSESHLNSLGICLFLAAARHFNKTCSFVVLDDVVSSFDTDHRRTLARLLRSEFAELQVILLTHDDLWFEQLKNDLAGGNWRFQEIGRWTYTNGITLLPFSPLSQVDEVRWLLGQNRTDQAANTCRVLIEATLKDLCERLGVTGLEFRRGRANDVREATDLMNALRNYLNTNKSLCKPSHKRLFDDVRADQLLTNIGSHHRDLEATKLKRSDVEMALRDVADFRQLFVCSSCGKPAAKEYSARNAKQKQCKCGNFSI